MPYAPPFLLNDAPAAADACKRQHPGSTEGAVLDTGPQPDAELHVIYRTQFRFHRFWRTRSVTPCWSDGYEKKNLPKAVEEGSTDRIPADDRLVQHEWDDRMNIRVGGTPLAMILAGSKAKGRKVWFPVSARLPKAIHIPEPDWKWEKPQAESGSPTTQWGIRGDATLRLKPFSPGGEVRSYKMVTVWQRWEYGSMKGKKKYSVDMCTLPPGTYAGYVQGMPKHWKNKEELKRYPAICIAWEWTPVPPGTPEPAPEEPGKGKKKKKTSNPNWTQGAMGWKLKNPDSKKRTTGIYVHPGNHPSWFLGCLAPGAADKQREWGFRKREDTEAAMWEILDLVGVSKEDYLANYQPPGKKLLKWFIIRVEAANEHVISTDGWERQRIWLD
jgi:hypothetical protein